MLFYRCDRCQKELRPGELRYDVSIEVKAAYDTIEVRLADLLRDHRDEMRKLIAEMDAAEAGAVEASIYKRMTLHLCPSCQKEYLARPVGTESAEGGATPSPVNIDEFLRSLGYPGKRD